MKSDAQASQDDFRIDSALKNISNASDNFSESPSKPGKISPVKGSPTKSLQKKSNKRSSTKKLVRKENDGENSNSPVKKQATSPMKFTMNQGRSPSKKMLMSGLNDTEDQEKPISPFSKNAKGRQDSDSGKRRTSLLESLE